VQEEQLGWAPPVSEAQLGVFCNVLGASIMALIVLWHVADGNRCRSED